MGCSWEVDVGCKLVPATRELSCRPLTDQQRDTRSAPNSVAPLVNAAVGTILISFCLPYLLASLTKAIIDLKL